MTDGRSFKEAESSSQPVRTHLLIVDDELISLALLDKVLSKDYDISEAKSGKEALGILRDGGIDLVLSDLLMPEMSGIDLLSAMQADPGLRDIPLMMITADNGTEAETEALRLGAVDVVRKPFVPQILLARVRNLIALKRSLREAEHALENEQQLAEQTLTLHTAEHDELTGLYTRQAFYHHVREYLEGHPGQVFEIITFDLDDFSTLNDVMGIKAGDRLLSNIGQNVLAYDAFSTDIPVVGHLGADHFAALHDPSKLPAEELFCHIQERMAEEETEFHPNCRLGVYTIVDTSVDPAVMCDRALQALRSTKGNFTLRFARYDDSMRQTRLEEQTLTDEMLPALHSGQFVVYYQPQVNCSTGELIGAEALVRWNHPKRGLLSPAVFLPLFERNGLITQLDDYVWETACRQLSTWNNTLDIEVPPVSVNISRVDIYGENLIPRITGLVERYGISREQLHLEITESAYMGDAQRLCDIVEQLSCKGFTVEMDDFGSAYSSLNMLKDIAVDVLKLDMRFLSGTRNQSRGGRILSSVVHMARWLKMPVIAEGVETKQQADYLSSIGCIYMQGFYFSRPIPMKDYEAFMMERASGQMDKYHSVDLSAAERFWDASTQTALIFNSYVGGAVIMQRTGTHLEMLRANDEFFNTIHIAREDYLPFMLNVWARFPAKEHKAYDLLLDRAANGQEDARVTVRTTTLDGELGEWTRNRAKLLAKNGNSEVFYVSVENVTAEKTAKIALAKQKDTMSRLYNDVPCGIMDYTVSADGKTHMVNFNKMIWKMMGYDNHRDFKTTFVKMGFGEAMMHPDDLAKIEAKAQEAIANRGYATVEGRLQRKDGSNFWAEIRLRCTGEGSKTTLQSVIIDIDDRREEETQKYGELLLSLFDGVYLLDYQADRCVLLRGTTPHTHCGESLKGLSAVNQEWINAFIAKDDQERVSNFVRHDNLVSTTGGASIPSIDFQVLGDDEEVFTVRSSVFPVDDDRFLFCCRDITKELEANEQAKRIAVLQATLEDEERYRVIVEQTETAVVEWNQETGKYYHSGFYDRYAMSSCDPYEVLHNRGAREMVDPRDRDKIERFIHESILGATGSEVVLRLKMMDGTFRWTRIRGSFLYNQDGNLKRTIGTFTDVDDEMRAEEKVKETADRLENILANISAGVGIYRIETDGTVIPLYLSDRVCQTFGFTREECDARIAGEVPVTILPGVDPLPPEKLASAKNGSSISVPRVHAQRKDGSWFWLRITCTLVVHEDEPTVCYATLLDVSNLVEAEQSADSMKELYSLLIESTNTITFDYRVAEDIFRMSLIGEDGKRKEERIPAYSKYLKSSKSHVNVASKHEVSSALATAIKDETQGELDIQATGEDGKEHWFHIKYLSLSEDGAVYRLLGRVDNIDDVMRAQEAKLELAKTDGITGLPNKDAARAAVDALMAQRPEDRTDVMVFLDIDNFKSINDTVGHLEADRILAKVGKTLRKTFRSTDIAARFGGDEFLIYMIAPGDKQAVSDKVTHFLNSLRKITVNGDRHLECSIGVTEITGTMRSFDDVFRRADRAMYSSKQGGKNQSSFLDGEDVDDASTARD